MEVYDTWAIDGDKISLGAKEIIQLSSKILEGMNFLKTVFLLDPKQPEILGIINTETRRLSLGYRTEDGIYEKMSIGPVEQKVLEQFAA